MLALQSNPDPAVRQAAAVQPSQRRSLRRSATRKRKCKLCQRARTWDLAVAIQLHWPPLVEGETVLDLGSGAGFDCFLASNIVGPKGKVIGVDMTMEMIARARDNALKGGYDNVEFRLGEIEALPVEDDSIDIIISNCVINLVPDKKKAFREAFRVLKPERPADGLRYCPAEKAPGFCAGID